MAATTDTGICEKTSGSMPTPACPTGAPRFAGTVLFQADEPDLPWWRVVRADGSLAKGDRQRALLRAEGVPFRGGRVDMSRARLSPG